MVLQGRPGEEPRWSVPSGQLEDGETLPQCCIRELREETGYDAEVVRELGVKEGVSYGTSVRVHYFLVRITGGEPQIQDPDGLIHEIAWMSPGDVLQLALSFPEDRLILTRFITGQEPFAKSG